MWCVIGGLVILSSLFTALDKGILKQDLHDLDILKDMGKLKEGGKTEEKLTPLEEKNQQFAATIYPLRKRGN